MDQDGQPESQEPSHESEESPHISESPDAPSPESEEPPGAPISESPDAPSHESEEPPGVPLPEPPHQPTNPSPELLDPAIALPEDQVPPEVNLDDQIRGPDAPVDFAGLMPEAVMPPDDDLPHRRGENFNYINAPEVHRGRPPPQARSSLFSAFYEWYDEAVSRDGKEKVVDYFKHLAIDCGLFVVGACLVGKLAEFVSSLE
jgi:hypothetical protein